MSASPSSRRDFLRGLFGRAADVTRDGLLADGLLPAAGDALARAGVSNGDAEAPRATRAPTPDELARAFAVPAGQEAIADALVAMGRLLRAPDGRVTEPALAHRLTLPAMGAATERWLERARAGRPLEPTRPQDAILLHAARAELGVT